MAAAATHSSDEGEKWEFESDHEKVNIDDAVAEAEGNQTTTPRSGKNTRVSTMTAEDLNGALSARTERAKSTRGEAGVFVTDEDFQAMLRNVNRKEQDGNRMRKLVLLLIFLIVLLAAVTLGTSIAAVEMSKESHISNAKLVDVQGNSVATKSSDMDVCSDGTMVSSGGCADSSKEDGSSTAATNSSKLKTVQVKEKVSLASSLSDKFFMALDEVVVYSDKGHTLRLGIHGFARVPVLNSRCGNVVHLYTAWNGRLTIDSTDLSFDAATEAAFENAGFSLAVGGVSGRRLSSTHTVEGFYSAVQGVDEEGWTCQDVPLPTLPETYIQHLTIYRPCAVAGVTGTTMDPCDSLYGGVVPGTAVLSSALQLATMSKTERVAASLSVGVAVDQTMFLSFDIETMKSSSYEVQVSAFPNHPGMQKVNLFDRTSSSDATFQVISSLPDEGRFYCNSSGAGEATPQKKQVEAEQSGVNTTMHFEFIDTIEEDGKMLRHFRMMPAEAFLEWMGSDSATRPSDAYYEFWDDADTLTPVRLLNPDGSLVVFKAVQMGATDAEVQAKLSALGSSNWASMTTCTDAEKELVDVMAPSLDVAVPVMYSPMTDLNQEGFSFYAKLHLDEEIEDDSSNGWETLVAAAGSSSSSSSSSLSSFAKYAVLSQDPMAMPDFCAEMCTQFFAPLKAEMQANPDAELCEASNLAPLLSCIVDVAAATNPLCAKTNFWRTVEGSCLASDSETDPSGRRLHEEEDDDFEQEEIDPAVQGGEEYRHRLKSVMERKKTGATQQSQMTTLKDGTKSVDISALDAEQRKQIAQVLGVKKLSSGRVVFNVSDSQMEQKGQEAWLEAQEGEHTTHSRRLMLDMVCKAPGVGVGCLFAIGYPWSCDPMGSDCKFSLAIKVQVGGPSNGALTVAGSGCIEEWAFGVPKPFSGSVCIDGGITVGTGRPCGLPFSLSGWVGITASVGLDLVLFSFSLASIRLEAGAQTVTYKYNCDSRRRRRRGWGGRRRGADETCSTACDVKVYAKATLQVLIGRIWAKAEYYVSHRDFDFILGADIYIWLLFTSWWETVAEVKIV